MLPPSMFSSFKMKELQAHTVVSHPAGIVIIKESDEHAWRSLVTAGGVRSAGVEKTWFFNKSFTRVPGI